MNNLLNFIKKVNYETDELFPADRLKVSNGKWKTLPIVALSVGVSENFQSSSRVL